MFNNIKNVLITQEAIEAKIEEMGRIITTDYRGKNLLFVCILKGSMLFASDLMRAVKKNCRVDVMCASSYGRGTETSGNINILMDLRTDVAGYDVLIVDDIIDSGVTLSKIKELLISRNPASIKLAAFLDKPDRRTAPIEADYVGFTIPDEFVVGYGLDYAEDYRNLPFVGVLKPEAYEKQKK